MKARTERCEGCARRGNQLLAGVGKRLALLEWAPRTGRLTALDWIATREPSQALCVMPGSAVIAAAGAGHQSVTLFRSGFFRVFQRR